MHFHFKRFSIGSLMVLSATLSSGSSASEGLKPSAVYGSPAPGRKISAPAGSRGADLVGSVKDSSGVPIQGATVFVYTAKPRQGTSSYCPSCYADCGKHQDTNANGVFRIRSLEKSLIFRVLVVKDGFEPTFIRNVDPLKGKVSLALKKVVLTPEQRTRLVKGRVLDPLGQPVVGALIEPIGVKTAAGGESMGKIDGVDELAITNQRGEFHFLSPSAGDSDRVKASARGLANTIFTGLVAGSPTPSTLRLPWGVTLRGTVTSASGKKLPGTEVEVVPADLNGEIFTGWLDITTDSTGTFTFYNVPANREYRICVKMDNLSKQNLGGVSQTLTTGHDDTVTEGINLTVKPAAILSGQVILTDGKKIPDGTRIIASRKGTWDVQEFMLSPAGKFAFRGVPQEEDVKLYVKVPGYHWADGTSPFSAIETRISAADTQRVLSLSLAPDSK